MAGFPLRPGTPQETCQVLAEATQPDHDTEARQVALTENIRDCDRRLGQYQAVLDEGADPQIVARWMAKVQRERRWFVAILGSLALGSGLAWSGYRMWAKPGL